MVVLAVISAAVVPMLVQAMGSSTVAANHPVVLEVLRLEVELLVAVLVVVALVGAVGSVIWVVLRRANRRSERLRDVAEERATALETEKQRLQEALGTVEKQAIQLLRMDHVKNRLFADLSHEFKTPLTLILDPLERAAGGEIGQMEDEQRADFEIARTNALRLLRLTNQLLDLSRIEAGAMQLYARQQDLVAVLDQAVEMFSSEAEHRGLGLSFRSERPFLPAFFDPQKLEKVVLNLVANAFAATEAGGKILVWLREVPGEEGEGSVEIEVRDTGCGIPDDQQPYLFDRFYQGDGVRRHSGAGIGLSLAKELVELHGGTISVSSTPGFGSAFVVRLPLGRDHLADHEIVSADSTEQSLPAPEFEPAAFLPPAFDSEPEGEPAAWGGPDDRPLVLVVEDHPEMRRLITYHLGTRYRVLEAGDAHRAFELARERRPALVVTDVVLPRVTGLDLCRRIKHDERLGSTPVIILTARAGDESRLEGLNSGADDYLTKPFSGAELLARAQNLIETRESLRKQFGGAAVFQPTQAAIPSADSVFMGRVAEVVEENLGDESLSVKMLASEVGVSESSLKRRLKAIAGEPPVEFIRNRRLDRAAQMLAARAGTVSEVAAGVGFGSPSYFAKCFRERFGVSPSAYVGEAARTPS